MIPRRPSLRMFIYLAVFVFGAHWFLSGNAIPRSNSEDHDALEFKDATWAKNWKSQLPKHPHEKPQAPLQDAEKPAEDATKFSQDGAEPLHCTQAKGMEDVVLIIKTGATEIEEKLPIHFNTTMACFPRVILISDFEEVIDGHQIHDVLGNVSDNVRLENPDFELWRRLKAEGRDALKPDDLASAHRVANVNDGRGNIASGGWRLDKFKFNPMMGKVLELHPGAKWYIFMETDTYMSWSNVLRYVRRLDHNKPFYIGNPSVIDNQVFAHGGSSWIMSEPAVRRAADWYKDHQQKWDDYAAGHWAGDCVLATLLEKDLGIPLHWAFPIITNTDPHIMDWTEIGYNRKLWCYPVVSYHHINSQTVNNLFNIEQSWTTEIPKKPIRHSDVFRAYVLPQLTEDEKPDWNNSASTLLKDTTVIDSAGCRAACEKDSKCLQYSFGEGECKTSAVPKLGRARLPDAPEVVSGWMMKRLEGFINAFDKCNEGRWIV